MRPEDEITCRQFVELVTDYFEGALPAETHSLAEEHLVMCDWCTTYAEQLRATSELLAEVEREQPEADAGHAHAPAAPLLAALQARREQRS